MFVEVATADVLGEEPELTQSEALRGAIKKRLNDLDASFMVRCYLSRGCAEFLSLYYMPISKAYK
jgi:hypothetical protein